jgi:glycosyltransferase involved in cell wall biosynthesis
MKTGWLVENQTEAWVEALDKLISDEDLRVNMARNATHYLFKKRVLSQCAPKWLEVVDNSLGLDVKS